VPVTLTASADRKVLETKVALAGDHSQVEAEKWRPIALQTYYVCMGALGVLLLFLWPPHLDLRASILVQVAITAMFLAVTQRPTQAAGKAYAPLTAVLAASMTAFGMWTLLLMLVSFTAIRLRLERAKSGVAELFSGSSLGQAGAGVAAVYAMAALWGATQNIELTIPRWAAPLMSFFGIMAVGLVWQIFQHGFAQVAYGLTGKPVNQLQFLRVGIIASLYGYLLAALYSFGGLLTAALFYALVAQTRMTENILGVTRRLSHLEHLRGQAASMIRELIRFTDAPDIQFTEEVENIARMLARHLGLQRKDVDEVGLAAELHQIGKCRLPARLRYGRSSNAAEEAQRKTYSRLGAIMVRSADALLQPKIADYIEYHTEHFDGTGYPRGLAGEAIPLGSRIIAVARAYVCLLTGYDGIDRVQKEEALRSLKQDGGALYDPRLIDLLIQLTD